MDSARWHQIQNLFHDAADLPQAEQKALLDTACNGDKKLIAEVLAMLDQDARGHSLLDRNLGQVALETLAKSRPRFPGPQRIRSLPNPETAWRRRNGSGLSRGT
jgi:hypothetical protein